ncbi:MAG TPA: TetR family transcriptional regulator [Solirubrobacterales bacterium]
MARTLAPKSDEKTRDATRSREAILAAAERLFSERGFDAASLADVALAAGLSRGAPNYFFGSKEQLYIAVLERVFHEREQATREAFRPLVAWTEDGAGSLEKALGQAAGAYMEFLLRRPSFLRLIQREELAGARRLREAPRDSRAIEDAFRALRKVAPERGLRAFDVADAVLLFVSLTFSPLAQRSTFMASLGRDFEDAKVRHRHVRLVTGQLLHLVVVGATRPA